MQKKPAQKDLSPLLYGYHAVCHAWLNPAREVKSLFVTEQAVKGFEEILIKARKKRLNRPEPVIIDKKKLDQKLPRGAVHQGLALNAHDLPDVFVSDLIIEADNKKNNLFVMLDQITDPHNVGAVLRSACAFGADGVIMQRKHAPDLTGVLAKTACGALEHIPVAFETNLSRALEDLKCAGFFAYGLDERGKTSIENLRPGGKTVLVLGAEGDGLRRLVAEHCDDLVRLPATGPIQSLNVSNAAAISLYALSAQLPR